MMLLLFLSWLLPGAISAPQGERSEDAPFTDPPDLFSNYSDLISNYSDFDNISLSTQKVFKYPCEKDGSNCSTYLERDEYLAKAEMATLSTMLAVAASGNLLVLAAIAAKNVSSHRPRIYYFMRHLSTADLCNAALNILPQLTWKATYRFRGGGVLCKLVKFGQTLGPYLSSYVLTATALDRYHAVCAPLTYCSWSSRRARCMILTAWILALLFCTPQLAIFTFQEVAPGIYDCWAIFGEPYGERIYVTWYCFSVFLVPLITLVYTYTRICTTIWRSTGPVSASAPHKVVSRAKINTIKQTVAVILLYIFCSMPFISVQLWANWDQNAATSPFLTGYTFAILTLLSSLNSCVNPWIYLISNRDLLEALWNIFSCKRMRDKPESGGSGGSNGKFELKYNLPGQHTHCAKWVVSVPPNISESDRTMLRLFRAPYSDVWSSVVNHYETTESKMSPEI